MGARTVPITIDAGALDARSGDAWRWAEDVAERLPQWDERARALLVTDARTGPTPSSNYIFSLSSIAAPRFQEMFGRDRWSVDFVDYARTLRIMHLRLCLETRRAILDYGLDGCVWRERLQTTLGEDGTLVGIASTRGGIALAELDTTSHGMTYLGFEGHLDNDMLVRAVDSLGAPGLAVYEILRGFTGASISTEMTLEGPTDSIAIARMLRDTLASPVALSAGFGMPWQWLLLDPRRGEWLVDEDARTPHLLSCRAPYRFDKWEERPAHATGASPADWTQRPLDGHGPEPCNYAKLVLPRDVPVADIESAVAAAGGAVVWTSLWDHCCRDVTFACARSSAGSLSFARSLAAVLRRDVVAGLFLRDGPAWVRVRPDGHEDLVEIDDASSVRDVGPFDASMLEDPPPRAEPWPPRSHGSAAPLAVPSGPPVYTTVYVSNDAAAAALAAIEALPVAATFVWTCESWSDHSAIVLRSTVDSLTVARAVATSLGRRVIVGLALRGEPGWVILDPSEREWIGEGWRWYDDDELRFVRLFDEGDVIG